MRKLGFTLLALLAALPFLLFTRKCGNPLTALLAEDTLNIQIREELHAYLDSMEVDTGEITVAVYDLSNSIPLYNLRGEKKMIPASCMKLLTAVMAYETLGLENTYSDSVFIRGEIKKGVLNGNVILKGDKNPLLKDSQPVINALKRHGIRRINGDILLDVEMEESLPTHWSWAKNDMPSSTTGLLFRGINGIASDLRKWMKRGRIQHSGRITKGQRTEGDRLIYDNQNTTADVMRPMLRRSDNFMAEALFNEIKEKRLSDDYIDEFIEDRFDISPDELDVYDGSGLSHENRLNADFFIRLLTYAYKTDILKEYLLEESLPVAGDSLRHGSLGKRMKDTKAEGIIRAKTGTLKSINALCLSGYAIREDGRDYCFSILMRGMKDSRDIQDSICKILCRDIDRPGI